MKLKHLTVVLDGKRARYSWSRAVCAAGLCVLSTSGASLRAQDRLPPGAPESQPPGAPIAVPEGPLPYTSSLYKLGPLDSISIQVEGHPEFSDISILVPSDGRIYLPAAGSMAINGLTIRQVTALVTRKLSSRLREPRVTVNIRSLRPVSTGYVNVVGDAVRPQIVAILPGWRLTEIMAKVGGVGDRLDETKATLSRRGVGEIKVDLFQAVSRPLSKANIRLRANDVLSIMNVEQVTLIGDIVKPGAYRWQGASTVLDAVNKAGGPRQLPNDSEAYVVRQGQRIKVDMKKALSFKKGSGFALLPGDVLAVKAIDPVTLIGDVIKPDSYSWLGASTLVDAVNKGGGLRQPARDTQGFITRDGRRIEVRLQEALESQDPTANTALRPGDVLTVEAIPALRIGVIGQAATKPGLYEVRRGDGVLDAILKAGGPNAEWDEMAATIQRGEERLPVDLRRLLIANDPAANIKLQDGDVVSLAEVDLIRIEVVGRVLSPKKLRVKPDSTLNYALTRAGGLSLAREKARISILRRGPKGNDIVLRINAVTLFDASDPSQNTKLRDGDLITVSEDAARTVYLSGDVANSGAFDVKENEGVPEFVTRNGGLLPTAALTRVIVRRGDKAYNLDILGALKRNEPGPAFRLQDGDFVVVPRNKARVLVTGAVANANYYPIPEREKLTVLEALTQAGFSSQNAKVKEVAVLRQPPGVTNPNTPIKPIVLALNKIEKGQLAAANFVLQPDDVVFVPYASRKGSVLQQIPQALGTVGLLRNFGLF